MYQPSSQEWQLVNVPDLQLIIVDGRGDPNTALEYSQALDALYAVAYKLKLISKGEGCDYVVPPLEGLWWADDMALFSSSRDKSQWDWIMMIMTPEWITEQIFLQAREKVSGGKDLPALERLRLVLYQEGLSSQILHLGPYEEEGPALARLHQNWMPENGYAPNGKHHEIYLSDPREVAAPKPRTILRQPVRKS